MRIIGVKISVHVTNFKIYVIIVLYFVVYVTISNYYYLNTLFMYGFCCPPPLQSLFLVICWEEVAAKQLLMVNPS